MTGFLLWRVREQTSLTLWVTNRLSCTHSSPCPPLKGTNHLNWWPQEDLALGLSLSTPALNRLLVLTLFTTLCRDAVCASILKTKEWGAEILGKLLEFTHVAYGSKYNARQDPSLAHWFSKVILFPLQHMASKILWIRQFSSCRECIHIMNKMGWQRKWCLYWTSKVYWTLPWTLHTKRTAPAWTVVQVTHCTWCLVNTVTSEERKGEVGQTRVGKSYYGIIWNHVWNFWKL